MRDVVERGSIAQFTVEKRGEFLRGSCDGVVSVCRELRGACMSYGGLCVDTCTHA